MDGRGTAPSDDAYNSDERSGCDPYDLRDDDGFRRPVSGGTRLCPETAGHCVHFCRALARGLWASEMYIAKHSTQTCHKGPEPLTGEQLYDEFALGFENLHRPLENAVGEGLRLCFVACPDAG